MKSGGLYQIWIDKYGRDIADKKMKEYKEKMKKSCMGENNGFYGKTHTRESRDKMRKSSMGNIPWNKGKSQPQTMGNLNPAKRPEVRKKISEGVKMSYSRGLRETRGKAFSKYREENKEEYRLRMEELGIWKSEDEYSKFETYKNEVLRLTKLQAPLVEGIDKRSREYHLDHIYSIFEGFKNNIPAEIISHHKNLRIVPFSENCQKGRRSEKSLNELISEIRSTRGGDALLTACSPNIVLEGGMGGH